MDLLFILGKIVRSGMKNAVYVSNAFLADCSVILEDVTITAQAGQGKKQGNYTVKGHNPGYIKFDIDKECCDDDKKKGQSDGAVK